MNCLAKPTQRTGEPEAPSRAWENLQEWRWVLKDTAGIELPPPVGNASSRSPCARLGVFRRTIQSLTIGAETLIALSQLALPAVPCLAPRCQRIEQPILIHGATILP
jgi:hypothetical protein